MVALGIDVVLPVRQEPIGSGHQQRPAFCHGQPEPFGQCHGPLEIEPVLPKQDPFVGALQGLLLRIVGTFGTAGRPEAYQVPYQGQDTPIGCHDHIPVPVPVRLGALQDCQGGREDAHPVGL